MRKITVILAALLLLFGCSQEKPAQPDNQNIIVLGPGNEELIVNQTNQTPEEPKAPKITSLSVSTERPVYYSREKINIKNEIAADGEILGVLVHVYGIETTRRTQLLDQNLQVNLSDGTNLANFTLDLPYCSYCSGMPPGTYYIYASALKENQTLASANCSFNFSVGMPS
jgi:hypothetical protein